MITIDDWRLVGCKKAVLDYSARNALGAEIATRASNVHWVKQ
jgi:hypothetical protein